MWASKPQCWGFSTPSSGDSASCLSWGQGELLLQENKMAMEVGLEMSVPTCQKPHRGTPRAGGSTAWPWDTPHLQPQQWRARFPTAGSEASLASLDNSGIWAAAASKSGMPVVNNVRDEGCCAEQHKGCEG